MADDITARLWTFLEPFDGRPVEWGVDDCSAWCAAWARDCGHEVHLPAYASEDEAHALIDAAGGLVNVWDDVCASAGVCERIGDPQIGDVGIIPTNRFGPVGVIWADNGLACWRLKTSGLWLKPRTFIKTWAIT